MAAESASGDALINNVIALAKHYQSILGLKSWIVHCYTKPLAEMPQDGAWGHIVVESEYWRARLTVAEETPHDELAHVVCHEIMHIATNALFRCAEGLADTLPDRWRKREMQLINEACESVTELLTRAIERIDSQ